MRCRGRQRAGLQCTPRLSVMRTRISEPTAAALVQFESGCARLLRHGVRSEHFEAEQTGEESQWLERPDEDDEADVPCPSCHGARLNPTRCTFDLANARSPN